MAVVRYIPKRDRRPPGEPEAEVAYKEQRAENERLKVAERDLKLKKTRGEVISRAACLRQAGYVMTSIRQRLLLVPMLAARRLGGTDEARHEAAAVIGAEIRAALEELANFPEKVTTVEQWERTRK
jgi:hypothetical protein